MGDVMYGFQKEEMPKISENNDKYEFTGEYITFEIDGETHTVYRIRAKKDIIDKDGKIIVRKGELGGFIEKEENLDYRSNAWVFDNARIFGDAWVSGNARVYDDAWVYGNARVFGDAWVYDYAKVFDYAWVYDDARVFGYAWVFGYARVFGNAMVFGNAWVYGNARVFGDAWVYDYAKVSGDARIYGIARVFGYARVTKGVWSSGDVIEENDVKEAKRP